MSEITVKRSGAKRRSQMSRAQAKAAWGLSAPAIIIMFLFMILPFFMSVFYSFTDRRLVLNPNKPTKFVGWANYIKTFTNKNELLHLRRGIYKLRGTIVKNTIAIGMSPFLMNLAACFIVIFINKGLKEYDGDLAIGAFGIVNRIVFLFVMIVMGLNQGMQPIAGYNFGAQQYHRVNQVLKLTIYGATAVTTTGFLVGELMPELAVSAFTTHEGLIQLSATGLRIVVIFFPIIGFQMVTSNFFQSIGMAGKAIFLSLTRQLLFLLLSIILLPLCWGSAGIWWSMPISDLTASVVAGIMLYRQFKIFKTHGNKLKVEN